MITRVTIQSRTKGVLADTNRNLARVARLQEQLSSGKRIQSFSDDPLSARRALAYRIDRFEGEEYISNVQRCLDFADFTDSALAEMGTVIDAVKQAAVKGASGGIDAAGRSALSENMSSQLQRLIDLGNTVGDGRFIFAGTDVRTLPFALSADGKRVEYRGNLDSFEVAIGPNASVQVNQNGHDLFQSGTDIFDVVIQLRDALARNDQEGVAGLIGQVDTAAEHITNLNGALGGRVQRLELSQSQLEDINVQLGQYVSREEDADLPGTIMDLQAAQVALEAGLQSGARVLQPSLLDYI